MKKEDVMKIEGMTEELAAKVAEASAEELKEFIPKYRYDEVNEAKKNAEALVKERDKQLEDLKKSTGDNEELKKQIETLQSENKQAKSEYEANIKSMRVDSAINIALTAAGAKNATAAKALLKDIDKAELLEDGTIKGLAEQIEGLKKSDSYLFNAEEGGAPAPKGATPAGSSKGGVPGTMTKEEFAKLGYADRVNLFETNRELYDSLAK